MGGFNILRNNNYIYPPKNLPDTSVDPQFKNYKILLDSLTLIESNYKNIPDDFKTGNEVIVVDNDPTQLVAKEKGLLLRIKEQVMIGEGNERSWKILGYTEQRYVTALNVANMIFEEQKADRGFHNNDWWPTYHLPRVINIGLLSTGVEDLTINRILTCNNQEIRTQLIKKKPVEEMEQYITTIHQDSRGRLVDINAMCKDLGRFVMVKDSSQAKPVMLRVPKVISYGSLGEHKIDTVQEALAWTFDIIPQEYVLEKET